MRNEVKTAMMAIMIVIIIVGGIGYYFTTLDKQKEILQISESDNKQGSVNNATSTKIGRAHV